jgi:hypothetical protein
LAGMPALKKLDLPRMTTTEAGRAELRKLRPDLEVQPDP